MILNNNKSETNLKETIPEQSHKESHRHICMKCNIHRECNKKECEKKYWLACKGCLNQNLPDLM